MAISLNKNNPDKIVILLLIISLLTIISLLNSSCAPKEGRQLEYARVKLINIEVHQRYNAPDVYYLVFDEQGYKWNVFVRDTTPFKRGFYYLITPPR